MKRLDGWKAIASHFGRDRTTVMRWARDRDLPIRRVPGGGTSSVYALSDELDRWLAGSQADLPPPRRSRWRFWTSLVVGVLALAGVAAWLASARGLLGSAAHSAAAQATLPTDPQVAAIYLQARDDWAQRTPASLRQALHGFGQVVSRDPGFARGYSGLADAYLLAREYAGVPEPVAYAKAKSAALAALALDPGLADAHRALGFIGYWWDHEPGAAGRSFRAALRLAPNDAQTHHWYGNILAANGEFAPALRELDRARQQDPGSVAIRSDFGWSKWASGDFAGGEAVLRDVVSAQPDYCSPHRYLAFIRLAARDYPGYLHERETAGRTCGDAATAATAVAQSQAFRSGGARSLQIAILNAVRPRVGDPRGTHEEIAFVASLSGDRRTLLDALKLADQRREVWIGWACTMAMRAPWLGDAEVLDLLARRRQPKVE